jgi:hypothetical protein
MSFVLYLITHYNPLMTQQRFDSRGVLHSVLPFVILHLLLVSLIYVAPLDQRMDHLAIQCWERFAQSISQALLTFLT